MIFPSPCQHHSRADKSWAGVPRARGISGGRLAGLSQRCKGIASKVKREMFNFKSQPTLYKILKHAGVDMKKIF
jgi:hypothetical protein